jgi:phage anti-repressor protein
VSEFPEWLEDGIGGISYKESRELHQALDVIQRYIPDINERLDATRQKRGNWITQLFEGPTR